MRPNPIPPYIDHIIDALGYFGLIVIAIYAFACCLILSVQPFMEILE